MTSVASAGHSSRRLLIRATARGILAASVLVALYYTLPLDLEGSTSAAVKLLIGFVAFCAVMVWQLRAISDSRNPGLRALQGMFLVLPLFLLLFASTYFVMGRSDEATFTAPLTRTDALYFTVTIFSTVGFGDISARSEPARLVVTVQMILDLIILGLGVRLILHAVQRGRDRLTDEEDGR